jgi:GxxExxY protein
LGYGFLEEVYENAMVIALDGMGVNAVPQSGIDVYFRGNIVGHYAPDLLVEETVIVEIKATNSLAPDHEAQLLNYLKATPYEVGLLLNFGPDPRIKRKIYDSK